MVLLRQLHDEIVGQGRFCGVDHALLGNIVQAVADVVPHGVVKQYIFLGDHGNLLAQRLDGDAADVHAVDANRARSKLVEARQQIYQRGFASAARANQGDHFSAARAKANILQNHGGIAAVGKTHIVEFDFARER